MTVDAVVRVDLRNGKEQNPLEEPEKIRDDAAKIHPPRIGIPEHLMGCHYGLPFPVPPHERAYSALRVFLVG